jgi:hypothetical protein
LHGGELLARLTGDNTESDGVLDGEYVAFLLSEQGRRAPKAMISKLNGCCPGFSPVERFPRLLTLTGA